MDILSFTFCRILFSDKFVKIRLKQINSTLTTLTIDHVNNCRNVLFSYHDWKLFNFFIFSASPAYNPSPPNLRFLIKIQNR